VGRGLVPDPGLTGDWTRAWCWPRPRPGSLALACPGSLALACPGSLALACPGSLALACPGSLALACPGLRALACPGLRAPGRSRGYGPPIQPGIVAPG
jgi:hypothetical protein